MNTEHSSNEYFPIARRQSLSIHHQRSLKNVTNRYIGPVDNFSRKTVLSAVHVVPAPLSGYSIDRPTFIIDFSFMGKETIKTMVQLATSAFGLVAALAWNDAIKGIVGRVFAPGAALTSQIVYAVLVTALAVFVTTRLGKISERINNAERLKNDERTRNQNQA
jgi:hypothetical protein